MVTEAAAVAEHPNGLLIVTSKSVSADTVAVGFCAAEVNPTGVEVQLYVKLVLPPVIDTLSITQYHAHEAAYLNRTYTVGWFSKATGKANVADANAPAAPVVVLYVVISVQLVPSVDASTEAESVAEEI